MPHSTRAAKNPGMLSKTYINLSNPGVKPPRKHCTITQTNTIIRTSRASMVSGEREFPWFIQVCRLHPPQTGPHGSPSRGWDVTELVHSSLFCSCVYFCFYGPFNCISFHKFSWQLSAFSFCSPGLISALLALSTIHLFMKVSFSPDVILCGWLGYGHQLTN